ncbi:hypothetical protein ABZX40_21160 [Streptomyces sp. NPDC004610]|uniref:hypothetical protein n=1 Tax=unclassified Streptomyces TaxID=2593676 RepID=UPI0033A9104B
MQETTDEIQTRTLSLAEAETTAIGPGSYALRFALGPLKGVVDLDLLGGATAPIGADSLVFASIAETPPGGGAKFLGAAKISILNLAPHQNGVGTRVFVDWPSELPTSIDFLVINN